LRSSSKGTEQERRERERERERDIVKARFSPNDFLALHSLEINDNRCDFVEHNLAIFTQESETIK